MKHSNPILSYFETLLSQNHIPIFYVPLPITTDTDISFMLDSMIFVHNIEAKDIKATLSSLQKKTLYYIKDRFQCNYICMILPDNETILCAGPVLWHNISKQLCMDLVEKLELPKNILTPLLDYYNKVTVLYSRNFYESVFMSLAQHLYGDSYKIEHLNLNFTSYQTTVTTDSSANMDNEAFYMDALYELSNIENELINAVIVGNDITAIKIWRDNAAFIFSILPQRLDDHLRNIKNYLISINTLIRKSLELNKLHVFHLEPVFSNFMVEIELCDTPAQLIQLPEQLLITYCEISRNKNKTLHSPFIETAMAYIKENLSDDLTLHSISSVLNLSPTYFSALFSKEMGISLTNYITESRISYAKSLLISTDIPIKNICSSCGFHNFSYFCHIFKKHTGVSPKTFRQNNFLVRK